MVAHSHPEDLPAADSQVLRLKPQATVPDLRRDFFLILISILCVWIFCLLCLCTMYEQCLQEGAGSPGTRVLDNCELPSGCWELSLGPLEEWPVLPNAESSLYRSSYMASKKVLIIILYAWVFCLHRCMSMYVYHV